MTLAWALAFAPQIFAGRAYTVGDVSAIRAYAEFSADHWSRTRERALWNPYVFGGIPGVASLQDTRPQWLPAPLIDAFDAVHRVPGVTPLAIPIVVHLVGALGAAALAGALWGAGALGRAWAGIAWLLLPSLLIPFAFGHDAQLMASSLMPAVLLAVHHVVAAHDASRRLAAAVGLALAVASVLMAAHPQSAVFVAMAASVFAVERVVSRRSGAFGGGESQRGAGGGASTALIQRRERGEAAVFGVAVVAGGAVLGVVMSAAVWWPAMLYTAHTVRGGAAGLPLEEVARWSASPADLLSLAWPWAAGFGGGTYWGGLFRNDFPQYAGVAVVVLATVALFARGGGGRRTAWVLGGLALLGMLLSLGLRTGALYLWAHEHVPLMSSFRVAINALLLTQLTVVLLSARGVESLLDAGGRDLGHGVSRAQRGRVRHPAVSLRVAGVCAAVAVAIGLLSLVAPVTNAVGDMAHAARPSMDAEIAAHAGTLAVRDLAVRLGVLAATLAALALVARPGGVKGRRAPQRPGGSAAPSATGVGGASSASGASVTLAQWFTSVDVRRLWPAAAALALLALDLGSVTMPFLWRATGTLDAIENPPPPPIARMASADPLHRALAVDRATFFSSDWIRWRARSISGVHPAVPRGWNELRESGVLGHPGVARALAVRWMTGAPLDSAVFRSVGGESGEPVGDLRGVLPRARAVPEVVFAADDTSSLRLLADPRFDPVRIAVARDERAAGHYADPARVRIDWRADAPDHLALEVTAPESAYVVVADTWLPGWTASVDGATTEIHRTNHLVRGVVVSPGRHRVEMRYVPEGWTTAVPASWAAWSVWLAAVALVVSITSRERARGRKEAGA